MTEEEWEEEWSSVLRLASAEPRLVLMKMMKIIWSMMIMMTMTMINEEWNSVIRLASAEPRLVLMKIIW